MRVAYDMSLLGAVTANAHQRHVFGICRVLINTVEALFNAHNDVEEVFFVARQCIASNHEYFTQNFCRNNIEPPNPRIHFVQAALPDFLQRSLVQWERYFSMNYVREPWKFLAAGRAAWWVIRSVLDSVDAETKSRLDIYHSPFGGFPSWTSRLPHLKRLMTVHDLIALIEPQHFHASTVAASRRALAQLTKDDWALCVSHSTRRDLLEHFPQVDPSKALVVPLAAASTFAPEENPLSISDVRARYKIPKGPYFLSLCTVEPRKNVDVIIRGFTRFCEQDASRRDVCLVLVGKIIERPRAFLAALEEAGAVRDRILFTGYVDDADLPALYSGASAFVYMSRYEGFGLPPLEAMQCGVPVIAGNRSSVPEVVGDAGILLDPEDIEGLSNAMSCLLEDEAYHRHLSRAGIQRAGTFSWSTFGQQTLAAYRAAIGQ